jgi:hypothetical protein
METSVEVELEPTLDRFDADLTEAPCEDLGVSVPRARPRQAGTTPQQRSALARKSALARWAKLKKRKPRDVEQD